MIRRIVLDFRIIWSKPIGLNPEKWDIHPIGKVSICVIYFTNGDKLYWDCTDYIPSFLQLT